MVVKETKNDPEGAEDVEEVTNELVVVVLQQLLGVTAVAIVCHLLHKWLLSWELEKARLFVTSAQRILPRICLLSEWMF